MRHDSFRRQFAFCLQSNPVVRQLHYLAGGKCNPDIPVIKSCLKKTKSDANDRDLAASALGTVGRIRTDSTTSKTSTRHKKRCHLPGRLATSPHFPHERIKAFFSPSKSRINSGKARNSLGSMEVVLPALHLFPQEELPSLCQIVMMSCWILSRVMGLTIKLPTMVKPSRRLGDKRMPKLIPTRSRPAKNPQTALPRVALARSHHMEPHRSFLQLLWNQAPKTQSNPRPEAHSLDPKPRNPAADSSRPKAIASKRAGEEKRTPAADPEQEHVESSELPKDINLEDHEWEQALGQSLLLKYDQWTDDTKEDAFREALICVSSHAKALQADQVFVFAATPSAIRDTLPDNFWALTQDVNFAIKYRQQHPCCLAIVLGKHFGPLIKLVNARIPTVCLQHFSNHAAVPVLARGICEYYLHLTKHIRIACHVGRVQVGQKTHHTVAFGLQQSSNERIRVGNLARDWNIITATPNSFNTASLDLCQPVCSGFEADTTNPFSLQVKGDRRSTDVISYLSNDSLACNIDIVGWVDQLVETLSNTTGACAISLHQAYIGTDHGELRQDLVVFVAQKHNDQLPSVNEFLQEQGLPVAPFYGYLIAQISPESFESLRLLANEREIAFPSSCQVVNRILPLDVRPLVRSQGGIGGVLALRFGFGSIHRNPGCLVIAGNTGNVVCNTSFTNLSDSRVKTEMARPTWQSSSSCSTPWRPSSISART